MCTRFGFENKFVVSHKICGHGELKISAIIFCICCWLFHAEIIFWCKCIIVLLFSLLCKSTDLFAVKKYLIQIHSSN